MNLKSSIHLDEGHKVLVGVVVVPVHSPLGAHVSRPGLLDEALHVLHHDAVLDVVTLEEGLEPGHVLAGHHDVGGLAWIGVPPEVEVCPDLEISQNLSLLHGELLSS